MLTTALVLVLKWLGPLLARLAVWRAYLPSPPRLATLGLVAAFVAVAGASWWLFARLPKPTPRAEIAARAVEVCTAANLQAENIALRAALADAAAALDERRLHRARSEQGVLVLMQQQETRRRASPNPDDIVIPAGDPWLADTRRSLLRGPLGVRQGSAP